MKKLFLILFFVGVAGSLPAMQFVFVDFDVTLLESNGQTPPDLDHDFLTVELGSFHDSLVPTAGNVADWAGAWATTSSMGYYDPTGPEWGAALTLPNNNQFAVGEQLYLWAFDTRSGGSEQWALFTDPSWHVTVSNGLDLNTVFYDFSARTTAILGQFNLGAGTGTGTASLAAITTTAHHSVPDTAMTFMLLSLVFAGVAGCKSFFLRA